MVKLEEGAEVQFVGVYVLHWRPEWGQPEYGFVEVSLGDVLKENLLNSQEIENGKEQD